ncbi:MAG: hypothetical protein ABI955_05550 [Nitrospirota bacterium]
MLALKLVLCGFLAVLGSVALAFVVGLVNPQEKVNGLSWSRRRLASMCWPFASMAAGFRGALLS